MKKKSLIEWRHCLSLVPSIFSSVTKPQKCVIDGVNVSKITARVVLLPLALKRPRASPRRKLSIRGAPALFSLLNRLTLSQSCCLSDSLDEAGLSPRSMSTGQAFDEACFLTCSFLLPLLGHHSNTSTPKKKQVSDALQQPLCTETGTEAAARLRTLRVRHCLGYLLRGFRGCLWGSGGSHGCRYPRIPPAGKQDRSRSRVC